MSRSFPSRSKRSTSLHIRTRSERESLKKLKRGLIFDSPDGTQVLVKVAISYVSIEGARKNLEAELPGWDFDKVRADAKAAWNKELSKIEVSGGTPDQTTTFYTALYHTMIQPNVFNDVDGQYLGHDGKIHQLTNYSNRRDAETPRGDPKEKKDRNKTDSKNSASQRLGGEEPGEYTVFSLWDTFRAAASALYDHRAETHGRFYQYLHPAIRTGRAPAGLGAVGRRDRHDDRLPRRVGDRRRDGERD